MARQTINLQPSWTQDSLATKWDKTEANFEDLYLRSLPNETYGWRDMVGQLREFRAAGAGVPTWTQVGTTGFYAYVFELNDSIQVDYHIDHDYAPGTAIYLHTHWFADGTNAQPVKWQMSSVFAKGHQQAIFDFSNPVVDTVTQTPTGTAFTHMIAELADPGLTEFDFEVDGVLTVVYKRITNGGTDNTDNIFLRTADCHYRTDRTATKNKAPNFYT